MSLHLVLSFAFGDKSASFYHPCISAQSIHPTAQALKALMRQNEKVTKEGLERFVDGLQVPEAVKAELKAITPWTFIGVLPAEQRPVFVSQ